MWQILYCELLKLKRSKIMALILLTGIAPSIAISCRILIQNRIPLAYWNEVLFGAGDVLNLFGPSFFVIFSGFIFTREYKDKTIEILYSYPAMRLKYIFCKLILIIPVIIICFILSISSAVILGLFLTDKPLTLYILTIDIKIYFWMILMHFALVPLTAVVSMIGKNDVVPVVFSSGIFMGTILLVTGKYGYLFPWSVPELLALKLGFVKSGIGFPFPDYSFTGACLVLAVTFVAAMLIIIFYLPKTDIN